MEKREFSEAIDAYESYLLHTEDGERRDQVEKIVSQLKVALDK